MKPYKILIACMLLCCRINANAQTILYKSVLASGGASFTSAGLSADWTVGQPIVNQYTTTGLVVTEGFHPVYVAQAANGVPIVLSNITAVKTYPNPTSYLLNISIDQALERPVTIDILDIASKMVKNTINLPANAHIKTTINMSALAAGTYIISLNANTDDAYIMKVVKQ